MGKINYLSLGMSLIKAVSTVAGFVAFALIIFVIVNSLSLMLIVGLIAMIGSITYLFYKEDIRKKSESPQEKNRHLFFGRE